MRLMEFIFSSCNDETLMDENNDESDDSFDIALKEAKLKRGKSTREYLADLDAADEKKRQAEEKSTSSISKVSDQSYSNLNESKNSVQGSVICLDFSNSLDDSNEDSASLSSISSDEEQTSININQPSLPSPCNVIATVPVSNVLHIPDGFSSIYYSSEAETAKVVKLKRFSGYLTDTLIEGMSRYYPSSGDVTRDPYTNDMVMSKATFVLNFNKFFHKGRIFINVLQLRQAVKEFFKHWNLVSKSNGNRIRCSYSHTPAVKKIISE